MPKSTSNFIKSITSFLYVSFKPDINGKLDIDIFSTSTSLTISLGKNPSTSSVF